MHTERRVPNRKLQGLRINAGLSQRGLAYETQVSAATIRLAERGFTPSPRIQYQLASYFELQPLDIWPLSRQNVAC